MTIISKKYILPIVVLILLLSAWGLRWEQGETVTKDNTKTVYYKDRWLGQQWYKYYAANDYSELPFIDQYSINALAAQLNSEKISQIDNGIKEIETNELNLKEEIGNFQWYWSKYAKEWGNMMKPYLSQHDIVTQLVEGQNMMYTNEARQNKILSSEQANYIQTRMPKELWDIGIAYNKSIPKKYDLLNERNTILASNKNEAKAQLIDKAVYNRKIATYSWFALSGIVIIWLLLSLGIKKKINPTNSENSNAL